MPLPPDTASIRRGATIMRVTYDKNGRRSPLPVRYF